MADQYLGYLGMVGSSMMEVLKDHGSFHSLTHLSLRGNHLDCPKIEIVATALLGKLRREQKLSSMPRSFPIAARDGKTGNWNQVMRVDHVPPAKRYIKHLLHFCIDQFDRSSRLIVQKQVSVP